MHSNSNLMDADGIATELGKRGQDHADKDAAYKLLDDMTKTVLAEQMVNYQSGTKTSVSDAEMRARASKEFREHLAILAAARREANRARVKYDTYRAWIEITRSNFSTERALLGRT